MTKETRIYNGEKTVSSISGARNEYKRATCKKNELRTFSNTVYKITQNGLRDLNVRPYTIKLLEENIGRTLLM